ncbi:MAG: cell wall anchor protein, partial [Clostridia bacterium]|nr:cell wall anchor protein [Clostridia bacterium]
VYASKRSAYALSNNNELYSWGQNNVGQLGTGNTQNLNTPTVCAQNVEDVAISGLHTVIITTENDVLSTGYNNFDQLGKGKTRDSFSTQVTVKAK